MLASVLSYALFGLSGYLIRVEANVSGGLPALDIVGLPDAAVKESRERVKAAVQNQGLTMPCSRVVLNLAPAGTRKNGAALDLPIAVAILAASSQVDASAISDTLILGELSMAGTLSPITGALPIALSAQAAGYKKIILPIENAPEIASIDGLTVYPAKDLSAVVHHANGRCPLTAQAQAPYVSRLPERVDQSDLSQIIGQHQAKRALEIAAAGGHSLLLIGPPGTGKTMLARCLPGLLPDMTFEEALSVTRIHSAVGMLPTGSGLIKARPFRAPHHTASLAALVGGGRDAHPGEVTLADSGVLFLDELPEYPRNVLDGLRQPLEDGIVVIARAAGRAEYPARAMLVAAMNPCPCGYLGSGVKPCRCTPPAIERYQGRVSGPLLDRIDLRVEVGAVPVTDIENAPMQESNASVKERVNRARVMQCQRFEGLRPTSNAHMNPKELTTLCAFSKEGENLLLRAMERYGLSMRARDRVRKVSRTIADLASSPTVEPPHVAEALAFRTAVFGG